MISPQIIGRLPVTEECAEEHAEQARSVLGAQGTEIEIFRVMDAPLQGVLSAVHDAVCCYCAVIHVDDPFDQWVFISHVLHGNYSIGVVDRGIVAHMEVDRGDVFILDPMMPHSAGPKIHNDVLALAQYSVKRSTWRRSARRIADAIVDRGGILTPTWLASQRGAA